MSELGFIDVDPITEAVTFEFPTNLSWFFREGQPLRFIDERTGKEQRIPAVLNDLFWCFEDGRIFFIRRSGRSDLPPLVADFVGSKGADLARFDRLEPAVRYIEAIARGYREERAQ